MYFISKLFWLCCTCVIFVQIESNIVRDNLDKGFWSKINTACRAVSGIIEDSIDKNDLKLLSMIEYTTFSTKRYDFPSAVDSLLNSTTFDKTRNTVVFIHGFIDNPLLFSGQSFALSYKAYGRTNILALDSHELIGKYYLRSSVFVKYIGEALGHFINDMVNRGFDVEKIHLVGHSLGAHIAGFAGKKYKELRQGSKLPRVTGLDPAGPCFTNVEPSHRLDKDDAKFVDIIHTNMGEYGMEASIGHVDFYPNGGGLQQPGCIESICSHNRVWQLYEESVLRTDGFVSVPCQSFKSLLKGECRDNVRVPMGFASPETARGVYYLRTAKFAPFGLGTMGVKPNLFDRLTHLID